MTGLTWEVTFLSFMTSKVDIALRNCESGERAEESAPRTKEE